jgi:Amt family ammonium transporter
MRKKVDQNEYEYFEVTNLSYVMFGGLFLWVGFIFFNAGSTLGMYKGNAPMLWEAAEIAAANTFMAGAGGGLICLLLKTKVMGGWNATRHMIEEAASVCNAFLAGMVANGAGMDHYDPWAAWVVGVIGGVFYVLLCKVFDLLEIDDAVEAF